MDPERVAGLTDGRKYALYAIPTNRLADSVPPVLQLADDTWVTRTLPFALPDHWKQWRGEFWARDLKKADLFLLKTRSSSDLQILNAENLRLSEELYHLYWGILIAVPGMHHDELSVLTGATDEGSSTVRQHSVRPPTYIIKGSPQWAIDADHLRTAYSISRGLETLLSQNEHDRLWRITHAFYSGLRAPEASVRLHQFVRCVEGFIFWPRKAGVTAGFVERTTLFMGPNYKDLARKLYDLRSATEHLRSVTDELSGVTTREKNIQLFCAAMQAEALARHCLAGVLSRPTLWPHFKDDAAWTEFWELPEQDRRALWGEPLPMSIVTRSFRPELFDRDGST